MNAREELEQIEIIFEEWNGPAKTSLDDFHRYIALKWLIARVRKLEAELQALVDYQFSVNDKTGALVKQHCKNALEERDEGQK